MEFLKLQNGSDVRGVALGESATLTPDAVNSIAQAFCVWLGLKSPKIAVGMDSRLSGQSLRQACMDGLMARGATVLDTGLASTPAMFMTTVTEPFVCDGAIMVTASHLPSDRNGLKFFTQAGGLEKADITKLLQNAQQLPASLAGKGSAQTVDFMSVYARQLKEKVQAATGEDMPLSGLKIIVDAGNGSGGFYASKVLTPLGADISGSQFLQPDGNFPGHIPNPEDKVAMQSLTDAVLREKADFGIIFDTDVDRAGAVDAGGMPLNKNRLIAAISAILLQEFPGTAIVTDSITSTGLAAFIKAHGGVHVRFKRGYKNVINEAIRLNLEGQDCQLAIETSGHAALKENYFLDDGAYLVTRLLIALSRLSRQGKSFADLLSGLKEPVESEEIRLRINEEDFKAYGAHMIDDLMGYAQEMPEFEIADDNHEGIRVYFDKAHGDGWFLVRLSLHDPQIPINIESDAVGGAKMIAEALYAFMKNYEGLDISPLRNFVKKA